MSSKEKREIRRNAFALDAIHIKLDILYPNASSRQKAKSGRTGSKTAKSGRTRSRVTNGLGSQTRDSDTETIH